MSKLKLDTSLFARMMIPPLRRTAKYIAWIEALLWPIQQINDELENSFRFEIDAKLKYNAQTITFEKILSLNIGDNVNIVTLSPDINNFYVGANSSESSKVGFNSSDSDFVGFSYNLTFVSFNVEVVTATWNALTQVQKDEFIALIEKIKYIGTNYAIVLI